MIPVSGDQKMKVQTHLTADIQAIETPYYRHYLALLQRGHNLQLETVVLAASQKLLADYPQRQEDAESSAKLPVQSPAESTADIQHAAPREKVA